MVNVPTLTRVGVTGPRGCVRPVLMHMHAWEIAWGLLRMPGTRKKKKRGGKGKVRKEGTYLWPDRRKVAHAVAHFGTIRGRRQGPTRIGTVRKIRTDDRQRRRTPGQGGALTLKQGVHVCRGAGRARPAAVPTVPSGTWGYWDS